MARPRHDVFATVRSEGALPPPSFLRRAAAGRRDGYGPYTLTHCDTEPGLQALRDPAALLWHEMNCELPEIDGQSPSSNCQQGAAREAPRQSSSREAPPPLVICHWPLVI